ncbi:MAG: ATP-binding protein [Nitrospira sp.]|jgi:signal transduction histidine kinase|nr:ATP-binding protein [Nitrospira sp.]
MMDTGLNNAPTKAGAISDSSRSTQGGLPLVLLLCFVIATALGLYALSFLRGVLVSERGRELAMNAATVADTLDRVMFERYGDIQLFAKDGILRDGTQPQQTARLLDYKQLYQYYSWLGVADERGQLLAATDTLPAQGTQGLNPESFELVRRTGQIHFEDMRPSSTSQRTMAIGFTAPIYGPKGEFRGVVATRVPFENLQPIFEQEGRLRYGTLAYDWLLLDREGTILSEKERPSNLNSSPVKVELPSQAQAVADRDHPGFLQETHRRRGNAVVTGYAWTRGYRNFHGFDWLVLFRLDRDQVYAPVDRLIWMVGGIGLLVILPLTGYGIWVSWELGRERNDLVEARHKLEESVAELGRSNADLQQFAYVASHDLQEPLRMVSSYTQLIAKRYKGKLDADADEFIAFAVDGANRMQRLIQDLLAYSRVKTGGRQFEPTAMETVLKAALANLTNAVAESHAVITHDSLPAVMGDEKQLAQLFQNLLSNAVKFRGPQPLHIHISAKQADGEWLFSVRDNGIGIDPEYADRIFVIFQRLHTREEYPGTGIGLAICKKIVERHGGRMWVESERGKGATFYFTLRDEAPAPSTQRLNR